NIADSYGRIGCSISSISSGSQNQPIQISFHPYSFDININYSNPQDRSYTFINNIDKINPDNNLSIAMRYDGNISALGFNGSFLSNFTDECVDIDTIDMDINASYADNVGNSNILSHEGVALTYMHSINEDDDNNDTSINTLESQRIIFSKDNFHGDDNISATITLRHNIVRDDNDPISPVTATIDTISFSREDVTLNVFGENTHTADGNVSLGDSTVFLYGKLAYTFGEKEEILETYGDTFFNNTIIKVYCEYSDVECMSYGMPTIAPDAVFGWYDNPSAGNIENSSIQNIFADTANSISPYIDINLTDITPIDNSTIGDPITIRFGGTNSNRLGPIKIFVLPRDSWLRFNKDSVLYPNGEIFFNIYFRPAGEWTGAGNTGLIVGSDAFKKDSTQIRKNW
ncbi:MAG: hypothetical protein DRQ78_10655, partial [Epsilonproteobacteria bacterium]